MNPNTAEFRRRNSQPGYNHMARLEYLTRAYEFAARGESIAKKLTADDVRTIRANVNGMTDKQQAKKYGVSPGTIYKVRNRITWSHV